MKPFSFSQVQPNILNKYCLVQSFCDGIIKQAVCHNDLIIHYSFPPAGNPQCLLVKHKRQIVNEKK